MMDPVQSSAVSDGQLLPPEILDRIIDLLCDDHATLRILSSVSKAIRLRSQSHIHWYTVSLSSSAACQSFYEQLVESPGISQFVKDLRLREPRFDPPVDRSIWLLGDRTLPLVIDMLVQVKAITFDFPILSKTGLKWSRFSPALKASLARLAKPNRALGTIKISMPTHHDLAQSCFYELFRFTCSCSTLKHLSLDWISSARWLSTFPNEVTVSRNPQLESLSLFQVSGVAINAFMKNLNLLPIDVTCLRKLVIGHFLSGSRAKELEQIWSSVADTLEDLTIVSSSSLLGPEIFSDLVTPGGYLARLHCLRRLTIRYFLCPKLIGDNGTPGWFDVHSIDFSGVYDANNLEELLVIFEIGQIYSMIRGILYSDRYEWRRLDELLARPLTEKPCSLIKHITFRLYSKNVQGKEVIFGDGDYPQKLKGWFQEECFPLLHAKGSLEFINF